MKKICNDEGYALVTSLMFTMMALVVTAALLYMVTASLRTSGAIKRYRTTTEAVYGGTDIMVKDLITASFGFHDYSAAHPGATFSTYMKDNYMANLNSSDISACMRAKLSLPKSLWPTSCVTDVPKSITTTSDVSFNLNSASGQPFAVYSKIVDTLERKFTVMETYSGGKRSKIVTIAGNSDTSITQLEGASVTEATGVSVPHYPYMYRIEVQAERRQNPTEKAKISVQYAY